MVTLLLQPLQSWIDAQACGTELSELAVSALIQEALLTPKPGLVDSNGSGAHGDLTLDLMLRSAEALREGYATMARAAFGQLPSQELRERLALLGRIAENRMMEVTGGINTHRGAIWALGLLIAGAAIAGIGASPQQIAGIAGEIARFPDRQVLAAVEESNGNKACKQFDVRGARGEAECAFPHVIHLALPSLRDARSRNIPEKFARLDALIAIIGQLDDTCLLHRGGWGALEYTKQEARTIAALGGVSTSEGWVHLLKLGERMNHLHISPGGSADLLAATLLLDCIERTS